MSRVIVLIATIPPRKRSCERLLEELTQQSRVPDGVILVCDNYGATPAPACPLPLLATSSTSNPTGGGCRWRAAEALVLDEYTPPDPDDIIVCLDDDIMLLKAPRCIEALVEAVEQGGGAAAAMGRVVDGGGQAPPQLASCGDLIYGAGCGLTVRAKHLIGVGQFARDVVAAGGPDMLGLRGDDDALVSAWLWKSGVRIAHAATGNIFPAPNTQDSSYTQALIAGKVDFDAQKRQLKKITGWPWPLA